MTRKTQREFWTIVAVFLMLTSEIAAAADRSDGSIDSDSGETSGLAIDPASPQTIPAGTGSAGTSKSTGWTWPDLWNGSFTVAIGFGYGHLKAPGSGFKYNANNHSHENCALNAADPNCVAMAGLDDVFLGFGGDILRHHYGGGLAISFLPVEKKTGGVKYQQQFYEFNGIYAPINRERMVLKLMAGIGGSNTTFISIAEAMKNRNTARFQAYTGVGIELYVTRDLFIRPQCDFRYIPRFTEQFGSKFAPGFMLWIGVRAPCCPGA
jgi:hypothetical protein